MTVLSAAGIRSAIVGTNRRLEDRFAPDRPGHPMDVYRSTLSEVEFSSALHLGAGRDQREVASALDEGAVVSLDPDLRTLELNDAEARIAARGEAIPFESDAFDLVFAEYVFEHLEAPWQTLAEIDRVLADGGTFVVYVPNPRHYYARVADWTPHWFHELYLRVQGHSSTDLDVFPTAYEWGTLDDVRRAERRFGWTARTIQEFHGPTPYTRWLPIHPLFILLDRTVYGTRRNCMAYLVRFDT